MGAGYKLEWRGVKITKDIVSLLNDAIDSQHDYLQERDFYKCWKQSPSIKHKDTTE